MQEIRFESFRNSNIFRGAFPRTHKMFSRLQRKMRRFSSPTLKPAPWPLLIYSTFYWELKTLWWDYFPFFPSKTWNKTARFVLPKFEIICIPLTENFGAWVVADWTEEHVTFKVLETERNVHLGIVVFPRERRSGSTARFPRPVRSLYSRLA